MRIVLDTNVVMSALLWRGKPYLLLGAIRLRRQQFVADMLRNVLSEGAAR